VGFLEDLAAEKAAQRPTADVEVLLNGNLYTLRFTKLDGTEWAAEVDKYPARPGILIDSRYGYDLRKLVKGIAHKCGVLLDGETEVPLQWDPPGTKDRVDEWADLFKALDGHAVQRIADAIWGLNEYAPAQAVEAAKKARSAFARN
jgi:hypothetical protein